MQTAPGRATAEDDAWAAHVAAALLHGFCPTHLYPVPVGAACPLCPGTGTAYSRSRNGAMAGSLLS